jgi:putative transposase
MYPHHIYNRGSLKNRVFFEEIDYNVFLKYLHNASVNYECEVLAYCLMPNHYHLIVIPVEKEYLSKMMQELSFKYTLYIQKKYKWSGHVFQSRFQSKIVEDVEYLETLIKYIKLNPIEAGFILSSEEYQWLNVDDRKILSCREVLGMGSQSCCK